MRTTQLSQRYFMLCIALNGQSGHLKCGCCHWAATVMAARNASERRNAFAEKLESMYVCVHEINWLSFITIHPHALRISRNTAERSHRVRITIIGCWAESWSTHLDVICGLFPYFGADKEIWPRALLLLPAKTLAYRSIAILPSHAGLPSNHSMLP